MEYHLRKRSCQKYWPPGTEQASQQTVDGKDVYTTFKIPYSPFMEAQMDITLEKSKNEVYDRDLSRVQRPVKFSLPPNIWPTFNADTKRKSHEDFVWRDILYQVTMNPGSAMKVMTLKTFYW